MAFPRDVQASQTFRLAACAFILFLANKGGRDTLTRRALHFPLVDTSSPALPARSLGGRGGR